MKRAKHQQPFLPGIEKLGLATKEFGGSLIKGNPRDARPISIKRAMHIVMRSSLAKGSKSLLHPSRSTRIRNLIYALARQKGIKVYRVANSGNHLHLLIQTRSRQSLHAYLRAITGIIARITLGVERGKCRSKSLQADDQTQGPKVNNKLDENCVIGPQPKFWDARPYTRIVEWGREFRGVANYIVQNTLEALGFIPYQPRTHKARLARAVA